MLIKSIIIKSINRFFFNYKNPRYFRFIYDLSRRYVYFFRGEQNSNMQTNGEYRILDIIFGRERAMTVFDVGANRGDYSKYILNRNKKCTIHCFEPDQKVLAVLDKELGIGDNIILNNVAVSDSSGHREIIINNDESELNSFYDIHSDNFSVSKVKVKTITLDSYCADKNIKHIDLLKIDTEGHEFFVLKGCLDLLKNNSIDLIQFEHGDAAIYSRVFFKDILDFLASYGYEIYKIKPQSLEKVVYNLDYERIPYANFIAVKAENRRLII